MGKVLWDGRAPRNYTSFHLDASVDPYLTVVKGPRAASIYTRLLGREVTPTPLWNDRLFPEVPYPAVSTEQALLVLIGNSSVFTPGSSGRPQTGFRRTELIAQVNGSNIDLIPIIGKGRVAFHFSVLMDEWHKLDMIHEHQLVFVEPSDGSHVFTLQVGSPFTNPTGPLPAPRADWLKILNHNLDVLFETEFTDETWHNFAVIVDWEKRTLQVWYSQNENNLVWVTPVLPNETVKRGTAGRGDFHFGILKLPLVNVADPPEVRDDVVHYGIQPPTTHGIMYSGVFIEDLEDGLSVGNKFIQEVAAALEHHHHHH
uniref:Glycoside hydrolase 131 catalytic N-terminal domain-containing protein n=1 Tax=Coprinopsis cinerea (strain Okayama-7 / 130 / ATCC MYA-4618 / FGSC 9003) TaxID=240176 RepID=UPI0037870B62